MQALQAGETFRHSAATALPSITETGHEQNRFDGVSRWPLAVVPYSNPWISGSVSCPNFWPGTTDPISDCAYADQDLSLVSSRPSSYSVFFTRGLEPVCGDQMTLYTKSVQNFRLRCEIIGISVDGAWVSQLTLSTPYSLPATRRLPPKRAVAQKYARIASRWVCDAPSS